MSLRTASPQQNQNCGHKETSKTKPPRSQRGSSTIPPSLQVFATTVSENCVDHAALRTEIVRLVGEARSVMAVAILKLAY